MASTWDSRAAVDEDAVTTIDADGVMLTFDHPEPGQPSTPRHGRRWQLHLNDAGYRLTDPQSSVNWHFTQPLPDTPQVLCLSAITDRNQNRITFHYTDTGEPLRVEHSSGMAVDVQCEDGRIQGYRIDASTVREFGYDAGDLIEVTNAVGATTRFAYDAHQMVAWIDSSGARYDNAYDAQGRVVSQTGENGVWNASYTYSTDGDQRLTEWADALGNRRIHRFDANLLPIAETDPLGRTATTAYTPDRAVLSRSGAGAATRFTYTAGGHLASVTDALGQTTRIRYRDGLPVETIDADGARTVYSYDSRGNLISTTDPSGRTQSWEYTDTGAVGAHIDAAGRRTEITCNAAGQPERVVDAAGHVTQIRYDEFGRVALVVAPDGAATATEYDAEGHPLRRTGPTGATEQWTWDGEGNCRTHTDAIGGVTVWEYGFYDLITARVDSDGRRTEFGYNAARQLLSVTNPDVLVWRYEYGPDGRLVAETDFNGATTHYSYDHAGRLGSRTNAEGQTVAYSYDAAGNLVAESSETGETVSYQYDSAGRIASARNAAGALELGFDPAGRIVSESWNGRTVTTSFGPAGEVVAVRTPNGPPVQLSYDARGAVDGFSVAGRPCEVSTDPLGRPLSYRYGPIDVASVFDPAGRLSARTVSVPAWAPWPVRRISTTTTTN